MKRYILLSGIAGLTFLISSSLAGQCVPDAGCIDVDLPGQICPSSLPGGVVGVAYEEVITIIPPKTVGTIPVYDIAYIVIDSVKNLPPGIKYTRYDDKFYPETAYCIDVTGTPESEGEYPLAIYVTPFVTLLINQVPTIIQGGQVVDDSSVVMPVTSGTGLNLYSSKEFRVFSAVPNPFNEKTRLGCYIPVDGEVELKVYNILGEEIYTELMFGIHGENYFNFNGLKLDNGAYFYGVTYQSNWHTGKFIKIK